MKHSTERSVSRTSEVRQMQPCAECAGGAGASDQASGWEVDATPRQLAQHGLIQRLRFGAEGGAPAQVTGVIQLQETLEQKIQRILMQRRIVIGDVEAAGYATELTNNPENTLVPIHGRHRALKLNRSGVVSSVEWRPPSDASAMRVSPMNGPMPEDQSSMLTEGRRPLTGAITAQDATIEARTLSDIPPRDALGRVMGGSAAQLSGIANSEWLHLVAHSLGGADVPANIVAGPHSLNTAMIPFERTVRMLARSGQIVDYRVTFFSDVYGAVAYVHHVEIGITLPDGRSGAWTLEVNQQSAGQFINGQVLNEIDEVARRFGGGS